MNQHYRQSLSPLLIALFFLFPSLSSAMEIQRTPSSVRPEAPTIAKPPANHIQQQRRSPPQQTTPTVKIQSGYCYVGDTLQKSRETDCQRRRGIFYTDQRIAQQAYANQSGYCCKDAILVTSSRKTCEKSKGVFFRVQTDAKKHCSNTKGFCCDKGRVTADTKGNCDRKTGNFFMKKAAAHTACNKENGFCCVQSRVIPANRAACEQKRGLFANRKTEAVKQCKTTRTEQNKRTAFQTSPVHSPHRSNQLNRQNSTTLQNKKVEKPTVHHTVPRINGTNPFFKPASRQQLEPKLMDSKRTNLTARVPENTATRQQDSVSESSAIPDSRLNGIPRPLHVVYIKDRMVRIGNQKDPNGLGNDLAVEGVEADFSCGLGSVIDASISITGEKDYTNLALHLHDNRITFLPFLLQGHNQFLATSCQPEKELLSQPATLEIQMKKACLLAVGQEEEKTTDITLPLFISCDLRADADPSAYNPYDVKYSTQYTASFDAPAYRQPGSSQMATATNNSTNISAKHRMTNLEIKEPEASLVMETDRVLFIDNGLHQGSLFQSPYDASAADILTSNIELQVSCGIGELSHASLFVKRFQAYTEIHQSNRPGKTMISDLKLMNKDEFAYAHCNNNSFYQDLGRTIDFRIDAACSMPNGKLQNFQQVIKAPLRVIACDRRGLQPARSDYEPFQHSCEQGYGIKQEAGQPRTAESSSRGLDNPMTCIELREQ